MTFYIDGNLIGSTSVTATTYTKTLAIGAQSSETPTDYFKGYIDEPSIWNIALTSTQVQDLYNKESAGYQYPWITNKNLQINIHSVTTNSTNINFTAIINNQTFTGTGSIITNITLNDTPIDYTINLVNITENGRTYFNRTFTHYFNNSYYQANLSVNPYDKIQTYNYKTGNNLNNFSVVMDTKTYNTTNGIIYLPTFNETKSITLNSNNYITKTTTINTLNDQNISLFPYMEITAKDYFNSSTINNFQVDYNSTLYNTTNGIIYLPTFNQSISFSIDSNIYFERNYTNYNSSNNLNTILYPYTIYKAKSKLTNATINNFTITFLSNDYSTNNGILYLPTKPNITYTLFIHNANDSGKQYAYDTVNITFTNYTETYTFYLDNYNSIDTYIYDEETGTAITKNTTLKLLSSAGETTYYTTTGHYYFSNLTSDSYTITASADSYNQRSYQVTVQDGSTQSLNIYLLNSTSTVIFTTKNQDTGAILEGTTYNMATIINGTWQTINTRLSDVVGQVSFNYKPNQIYKFTVSQNNFITKTFELNPILSSQYTIWLSPTKQYNISEAYSTVGINYYVNPYYADNNITLLTGLFQDNRTNNFTFVISAPQGDLASYSYDLSYKGNSVTKTGNNAYGDTLNSQLNITNANILDTVTLTYNYTSTISGFHSFKQVFTISNTNERGLISALRDNKYGLGVLERVLIVILITAIFGGLIGLFNGQLAGAFASAFIMGYFIFTGFLELWFLALPILLLFMFVLWRGE